VVLAVGLIGATAAVLVGARSDVSLGDEVYHFYMAKRWVEGGHRPVDDPQIHASSLAKRKYMAMPLWHAGLAGVWSVTGIRQDAAQVYQGAWYVVLVLATYDVGRRFYGRRVGLGAAVLMATMPFAAAYTNMIYVDVAVAAMSMLVLSCLVRRHFLWAGVMLSLAFLTKQNAYFLAPGVGVAVMLLARGTFFRRLAWATSCLAVAAMLHVPEMAWRQTHLGSLTYHPPGPTLSLAFKGTTESASQAIPIEALSYHFEHPSDIIRDPTMLVRYLGVPLLAGLALGLGGGAVGWWRWRSQPTRGRWRPTRGWVLGIPVLLYVPQFLYLFRHDWGVRYLAPILPLLCVIAARSLSAVRPRRVRAMVWLGILAAGVGQFVIAEAYLYEHRKLKPDMLEAYRWIGRNTEPNAGILCQNAVLAPMTGRRALWHTEASLPEIGYLLWVADEEEARLILRRYQVEYIFVELPRVYDDRLEHKLPDWPRSFVAKLESWPSMRPVFRNSAAAVWRVAETRPTTSSSPSPATQQQPDASAPGESHPEAFRSSQRQERSAKRFRKPLTGIRPRSYSGIDVRMSGAGYRCNGFFMFTAQQVSLWGRCDSKSSLGCWSLCQPTTRPRASTRFSTTWRRTYPGPTWW
jgi:hypothetical protein